MAKIKKKPKQKGYRCLKIAKREKAENFTRNAIARNVQGTKTRSRQTQGKAMRDVSNQAPIERVSLLSTLIIYTTHIYI